jgi:hypothetical protein
MKRSLTVVCVFCIVGLVLISNSNAQRKVQQAHSASAPAGGKISVPCPRELNDITDCPDTGCGPSLDPLLNKQKNIRSDDQTAEPMTFKR